MASAKPLKFNSAKQYANEVPTLPESILCNNFCLQKYFCIHGVNIKILILKGEDYIKLCMQQNIQIT